MSGARERLAAGLRAYARAAVQAGAARAVALRPYSRWAVPAEASLIDAVKMILSEDAERFVA